MSMSRPTSSAVARLPPPRAKPEPEGPEVEMEARISGRRLQLDVMERDLERRIQDQRSVLKGALSGRDKAFTEARLAVLLGMQSVLRKAAKVDLP